MATNKAKKTPNKSKVWFTLNHRTGVVEFPDGTFANLKDGRVSIYEALKASRGKSKRGGV